MISISKIGGFKKRLSMAWADDEVAGPMGYRFAVLFPQARVALATYCALKGSIRLPSNICRTAAEAAVADGEELEPAPVDSETGLAEGLPVYLYGYRTPAYGKLSLDPLMTGWVRKPACMSSIVSFGRKKMMGNTPAGGAFLTNDMGLAEQINQFGYWPDKLTDQVRTGLQTLTARISLGFYYADLWDRYLGDTLIRIPAEQVVPWRIMRRVPDGKRDAVVSALRAAGFDAGTNYPPLTGRNEWGNTVLNLFVVPEDKAEIPQACEIIKRVMNG